MEKFAGWSAYFRIKAEEEAKAVKRNKTKPKAKGPKALMSDG